MRQLGSVVFYVAGIAMLAFEVFWFSQWWGIVGTVIALAVPPITAVFPFIYLFMEGFSPLYFGLWAVALAGAAVGRAGP